jgi:hypothetical protein
MPKVYNIGSKRFFQFIKFPVNWENKIVVKGWTQEIEEPFRTATPYILKLPFYRALVLGKWTGKQNSEESALNNATQGRILKDEDFQEGWIPPAYETGETDLWDWDA